MKLNALLRWLVCAVVFYRNATPTLAKNDNKKTSSGSSSGGCHLSFMTDHYSCVREQNFDLHHRCLKGGCHQTCRPHCITLKLDVSHVNNHLKCDGKDFCNCEKTKCAEECTPLQEEHELCSLEEASCLGPTMYDNVLFPVLSDQIKGMQCSNIPSDNGLCRFKDFPLVLPKEIVNCENCDAEEDYVYFEYCNVIKEEHSDSSNRCNDKDCDSKYTNKVTEPFNDGWTIFTVSAPLTNYKGATCNQDQSNADPCFLQRIEIYYPEKEPCDTNAGLDNFDNGGSCPCEKKGCPNCHACPLIEVGDTFGPLEVVGFGSCNKNQCQSCDQQGTIPCEGCNFDCNHMVETCYMDKLNFEDLSCTLAGGVCERISENVEIGQPCSS
uniref:Uncharacterized protein n=1 Tax=Attheya septentrionalis TaxID=420275 RepID=A0A7S2XK16_9STRA|mmetsp:Transcript_14710/g.26699  ORF Transcript_14710/g.26699 Transcript_14710/m.26699 type:complete len:381 (+) Transcript_14710:123-1265(+)